MILTNFPNCKEKYVICSSYWTQHSITAVQKKGWNIFYLLFSLIRFGCEPFSTTYKEKFSKLLSSQNPCAELAGRPNTVFVCLSVCKGFSARVEDLRFRRTRRAPVRKHFQGNTTSLRVLSLADYSRLTKYGFIFI